MANHVGFRGFTKAAKQSPDAVAKKIDRMTTDGLYVYFTGGPARFRKGSGRSAALQCVTEKHKPVPLTTLIERAAKCGPHGTGYSPEMVRAGLFLHRNSKPAVYLPLRKREDGAYVADTNIPNADGFPKGLKEGDVVIDKGGKHLYSKPKELPAPTKTEPKKAALPAPKAPPAQPARAKGQAVARA